MKYRKVALIVGITEDESKEWDSQCDEIFHGPCGKLHDPENNWYVVEYDDCTKEELDKVKYDVFDEYGGI